jgi:hypothetical protein
VSRLAPAFDLVDVAKAIAEADHGLAVGVHARLDVIAQQIRALQAEARRLLVDARAATKLHRAECRFRKRVGAVYHLYERPDGSTYFSMIAPHEWATPPHVPAGSYRLEPDMTWTAVDAHAEHATRSSMAREVAELAAALSGDRDWLPALAAAPQEPPR